MTILPMALSSCTTLKYVSHTVSGDTLVVKKIDLIDYKFVIVKSERLPAPVYLTQSDGGDHTALLMECTHQKCDVSPVGKELHCPCHGSAFSNTGEVLAGPAEFPLKKLQVTQDAENLYIR